MELFHDVLFVYSIFQRKFCNFASDINIFLMDCRKDLNRIKVVLAEKKRTAKWLAQQLGREPSTVSKWCTNTSQPDLATLLKIATLLDSNLTDLINNTEQ